MTDEGMTGTPMDPIELAHALKGIAEAVKVFRDNLVEQGFSVDDALRLTTAYVHGMAGGKLG